MGWLHHPAVTGKKWCPKCQTVKPLELWGRNAAQEDGLQTHCKSCRSAYSSKRYAEDEDVRRRTREAADAARARNRERFREYLRSAGCCDCGIRDPEVLSCDHVSGRKAANVSDLVRSSRSWATILIELAKCVVRCHNCHARMTHRRRSKWAGIRRLVSLESPIAPATSPDTLGYR